MRETRALTLALRRAERPAEMAFAVEGLERRQELAPQAAGIAAVGGGIQAARISDFPPQGGGIPPPYYTYKPTSLF